MLHRVSISLALSVFAALGLAGDLVVDAGEFLIGPGDTYQNVTVIYPGSVSMTGGTVTGDVTMIGAGSEKPAGWSMTGGVVSGDFDLDGIAIEILGGRVDGNLEQRWPNSGGEITIHDSEVLGLIRGDEARFEISVLRSTIGSISINLGDWEVRESLVLGDLYSSAHLGFTSSGTVVDSVVEGGVGAAQNSSAMVMESTVASASNADILDSIVLGDVDDCVVTDSFVGGDAVNGSRVFDSTVSGDFISFDFVNPGRLERSDIGGRLAIEDGTSFPVDSSIRGRADMYASAGVSVNSNFYGGLVVGDFTSVEFVNPRVVGLLETFNASITLPVYTLVVDGESVALARDGADSFSLTGDAFHDIEMITPDGGRSAFRVESYGSTVTFVGTPLEGGGCSPVDLAVPFGVIDLADIIAFVSLYELGDPAADLAGAFGVLDLADVTAFVDGALAGCP